MEREALEQYPAPGDNLPEVINRLRGVNDAVWALLFIELGNMLLFIRKGVITPLEAINRLRESRVLLAQAMGNKRAAALIDEVIRLFQSLVPATSPDDLIERTNGIEAEIHQFLESWPMGPTRH